MCIFSQASTWLFKAFRWDRYWGECFEVGFELEAGDRDSDGLSPELEDIETSFEDSPLFGSLLKENEGVLAGLLLFPNTNPEEPERSFLSFSGSFSVAGFVSPNVKADDGDLVDRPKAGEGS